MQLFAQRDSVRYANTRYTAYLFTLRGVLCRRSIAHGR